MLKHKFISFAFLCFLTFNSVLLFSQNQDLILKFKKDTPSNILNNFTNNSPAAGNSSFSKLCFNLGISNSRMIFRDFKNHFSVSKEYHESGLDRIFILKINPSNLEKAIKLLSNNEYVEYIETDLKLNLENSDSKSIFINDPYLSYQYYLNLTGIPEVWNNTYCDSTIIIGVIDSGLDFLHQDLQQSYFINKGEYGNGKESNGIDDDNNGFTDDWRGWNFIDYKNDPSDDNKFSHGTAVTGIINASINNGIGIASVAPKSKVLVLRCFDIDGYGKESDVASAILYGASMGVRIFNFSFGDYIYSNLLKDVIRFAYFQNIFISCSAGNDASFALHYPSAFDEVTSVAASDQNDTKASFSSYGVTVDIFAPGSQILTTTRTGKGNPAFNNDYDYSNGTSFSAPIISGVAAMLLTRNHSLKPEEIKGILVSTTSYMQGQNNWNFTNASGRVNAINSFNNFNLSSSTKIHTPFQDYTFDKDTIPICVSAASSLFSSFSVYYGAGIFPLTMNPIITNIKRQALADTIIKWNTSTLADTSYTLSLVMNTLTGRNIEHNMVIFKDRTNPAILDYTFGNLIDKNNYSELIEFVTNKKTLGKIFYKRTNISEPYQYIYADGDGSNIGVISTYHSGLLRSADLYSNTEYEFYLEAEALNGKSISLIDTGFHFTTGTEINNYGFVKKNYFLPVSQVCGKVSDIFGNNRDNVFINEISNNYRINLYQFLNGNFVKVSNNNWADFIIARDLADINNDGKNELLCSKSRNGYLYQPSALNQLPAVLIWSDTLNNNFWSSKIADTDGDSLKEILGFGKTGLRILENNGNNNFTEIANLPYEGGITSESNSQSVLTEDFDSDGKQEIVFSNLIYSQPSSQPKTVIQIYRNVSNNTYQKVFSTTLDKFIKAENLVSGDFDGDGKKEFTAGTITNANNPTQYYTIYMFKYNNNNYNIISDVNIYNYKPNSETSTKSADIDNDGRDEILINSGTYFYILKYDNSTQKFSPVFFLKDINAFNQISYDFDKNGLKEIGLNSRNDTLFFFEKNSNTTITQTPLGFNAFSMDSNKVYLNFYNVQGAEYYKIYRSDDSLQNYILIDSVIANNYTDVNILNRKNYYYRISAVDTNNIIKESPLSDFKKVFVHNKSKLISANYLNNGFLAIKYSEKINHALPAPSSFILNNNAGYPVNASFNNDFGYFLNFNNRIPNGNYSVYSINLTDFYGSPVDSNAVNFSVLQIDTQIFYLKNLKLASKNKLYVEFNLTVDSISASNFNNYIFEPFYPKVLSVDFDNTNKSLIYLNLENKGYIGPSGKNYILRVKDVFSGNGIKIVDGAGSSLGLTFTKDNLDEVFVYPNPYKINSGNNLITFANLTQTAEIYIYDLTGKFIKQITETDKNGGAEWDLKVSQGYEISSGIYIYRVTGKDSNGNEVKEKIGKFAVIK